MHFGYEHLKKIFFMRGRCFIFSFCLIFISCTDSLFARRVVRTDMLNIIVGQQGMLHGHVTCHMSKNGNFRSVSRCKFCIFMENV